MNTNFRKLALVFPALFLIELIFGFSGTMIIIKGVAIRHILFILSFVSLYGYFFIYIWNKKIKIFSRGKDSYFGSYTWIDVMAIVFEVSMILSMTLIPWMMGTNLDYAHSEVFDSAAIFSLYFPLAYLVKKKEIKIDSIINWLKYLIFLFAVMHIVLYLGQEYNANFIQNLFDNISSFFNGNSQPPRVILGHMGYTRVMFTTSIYLVIGIYIYLRQIITAKWYDDVILCVEIMAIIATVTKSLWLGVGIAFCGYLIIGLILNRKNRSYVKKIIKSFIVVAVVISISNLFIFHGIVTVRMKNAFVTEQEVQKKDTSKDSYSEEDIEEVDRRGAAESNQIKLEQAKKLSEKWLEAPVFGWGYGSFVDGYLRSQEAPFSYEMQFFALLMKIGFFGVSIWVIFFILQCMSMIKQIKKNFYKGVSWLFLLTAVALCVQTNPLLISFTGMSVILFICLLSIEDVEVSKKGKNDNGKDKCIRCNGGL